MTKKSKIPLGSPLSDEVGNRKFAHDVFDSACHPVAWLNMGRRLRSSAEAISERENRVAKQFMEEMARLNALADKQGSPSERRLETESRLPDFSAAFMLVAFALENLLKGLLVAKGHVMFPERKIPKELLGHDLNALQQKAKPKVKFRPQLLKTLTETSIWHARYPLPLTIEDFWPMNDDGTWHILHYPWFSFELECWAYFDAVADELQKMLLPPPPGVS